MKAFMMRKDLRFSRIMDRVERWCGGNIRRIYAETVTDVAAHSRRYPHKNKEGRPKIAPDLLPRDGEFVELLHGVSPGESVRVN